MVNLPDLSFLWPAMLLFLGFIPLCIGLYFLLQQRRQRIRTRFGTGFAASIAPSGTASHEVAPAVQEMPGSGPGVRRHIPPAIFLLSLTILIIALARPQATVSLPKIEGTVMLAFDVSGSMAADDLKPSRMESAKIAASEFVQRQPRSVQIGVVAFSGGGFAVQAPTNDQEAILASIERLGPESGTSLAHGILVALDAISQQTARASDPENNLSPEPTPTPVPKGTYVPAVIVLLSDGENTAPPEPLGAAQIAAERGVRIYTVGVGSAAGKTLQIEGFTVHTRLDERTLQQISQLTGGEYFYAGTEGDLRTIYEGLNPQLVIKPEKMEITPILAGAGMLFLLIGSAFSLLWFGRLP